MKYNKGKREKEAQQQHLNGIRATMKWDFGSNEICFAE